MAKNIKLKIGIVGCGAIGSSLAKFIVSELPGRAKLVGLYDLDNQKLLNLAQDLKKKNLAAAMPMKAIPAPPFRHPFINSSR